MRLTYFPNAVARNGDAVLTKFLQSCRDRGFSVRANDIKADVAVIWSQLWYGRMRPNQEVWQIFRCSGRPVITLEVGALQRGRTWRAYLNDTLYANTQRHDSERRQRLGLALADWYQPGHEIVIALQHGHSNRWPTDITVAEWCQQTIQTLREHTDRAIAIREHPRFPVNLQCDGVRRIPPQRLADTYDSYDIQASFCTAWAVVNYNSNPGIDAAIHGVPVFVHASSGAAPVGNLDLANIETPSMPDREQWLNDLAWTEWTEDEIQRGQALESLLAQWSR